MRGQVISKNSVSASQRWRLLTRLITLPSPRKRAASRERVASALSSRLHLAYPPARLAAMLVKTPLPQTPPKRAGLAERAEMRVSDLSHGERKQLELAVALATEPRLLLLDEPMAGLGHGESARMVEALCALKGKVAMLLVEHDMDAVFALADQVSVLVYGRIIATGSVSEVRDDPQVRAAYLGEGDA